MIYKKQISAYLILVIAVAFLVSLGSCRKLDKTSSNGQLAYSVDTLLFDTVFTARGTSTRSVKIINKEKDRLKISSIRLHRGETSPYFINVNGQSGKNISDINIEGNDSLWVFASVNIEPGNVNDPFVVEDRLIATVGDREFVLPILGYGQDAIYITDSLLQSQTWTKTKPYVIINNAYVDEGQTLTIEPGTRIYVHADSRLYMVGNLIVNGTKEDSVVFQGDRIDRRVYFDESGEDFSNGARGEWGGLYFLQKSYNNKINYTLFKNGGAATMLGDDVIMGSTIQIDPDTVRNGTPKLLLTNSIIRNSEGYGVFAFNSSLKAENCLIFAGGKEGLHLSLGGKYDIFGCTMANYTLRVSPPPQKPIGVVVMNFFVTGNNTYDAAPLDALFRNCIIYGNAENEFFANKVDDYSAQIRMENCLIRGVVGSEGFPNWVNLSNSKFNENPLFLKTSSNYMAIADDDYHVEEASPAKASGISFSGMMTTDIEGTIRTNPPTIGCYQ